MFFNKKKEEWFVFKKKNPPSGIEVIMCDYDKYWLGKIESYSNDSPIVFKKNDEDRFEFSSEHSCPIFWRYLPNRPARLNPDEK